MKADEFELRAYTIRQTLDVIAADIDRIAEVTKSSWIAELADRLGGLSLDLQDLSYDTTSHLSRHWHAVREAIVAEMARDEAPPTPVTAPPAVTIVPGEPKKK